MPRANWTTLELPCCGHAGKSLPGQNQSTMVVLE